MESSAIEGAAQFYDHAKCGVRAAWRPPVEASSEAYLRDALLNRTLLVTLLDDTFDPSIREGKAARSFLVADDSPRPASSRTSSMASYPSSQSPVASMRFWSSIDPLSRAHSL